MNEQQLKINKGAKAALKWESWEDLPKWVVEALPRGMFVEYYRFHDSRDWADLLVKKVLELNGGNPTVLIQKFKNYSDMVIATPLQITQACLEVLNG